MVKITCYDGVSTIGGNKILLQDGDSALLLDFGKSFSDAGRFFDEFLQPRTNSALRDLIGLGLLPEIPGIYRQDLLALPGAWEQAQESKVPAAARRMWESELPSCESYLEEHSRPRVDGVLLSHGHADHFQHISFLSPEIPVYGSPVTRAVLRACQETGHGGFEGDVWTCPDRVCTQIKSGTFPGAAKIERQKKDRERPFTVLEPFERKKIGGFEVEPVPVDHSVPGAYSYIITCPSGKTIFYTGDLRFHGRLSLPPFDLSARLRERVRGLRPDVAITEGTRIEESAGDSEREVEDSIRRLISDCGGLGIVDFGWKDTTRFETILSVARATGRKLAVSPKVALLWEYLRGLDPERYHDLAADPNVRVYLERRESMLYSLADYTKCKYAAGVTTDWDDDSKAMKGAYESQDEEYLAPRLRHYRNGVRAYDIAANPRDYILHAGYFDLNELFDVEPPSGSIFIRAATEPFSDEMRLDEARLATWLRHFGLLTEGQEVVHQHASGHANGDDLCQFLRDMEPRTILPIHTEHPDAYVDRLGDVFDVMVPIKGQEIAVP